METLNPNTACAAGYISHISEPYFKGVHEIVEVVLDCEDRDGNPSARNLHAKAWDDLARNVIDNFKTGDLVKVRVVVYSHRNKNNPDLWYHVISLREISKK